MTQAEETEFAVNNCRKLSGQNYMLFVAGIVSVLASLLFPLVPALVDLLLIFCIALAVSVIVICLSAKKPAELKGFAFLIVTSISVLLTAIIASAKLVVIENAGGLFISRMANLNIIGRLFPAWLSLIVFVAISLAVLIAAGKWTSKLLRKSRSYLEQLTTMAQAGDEPEFVIFDQQRQELAAQEKGFFFAMNAFGRLTVWMSVLISGIVMLSLVAAVLSTKADPAVSGKRLISLAASSGLTLQTLSFLLVIAVTHLTTRIASQSSQQSRMTEEQFQQRIKVVAREVAATRAGDVRETFSIQADSGYTNEISQMFDPVLFEDQSAFDTITELLAESDSHKVVLMAASDSRHLPVTFPVNIATRLAGEARKTLIIDFDLKRSAVQQVFETGNCDLHAIKTCIENISLISGRRLASAKPQILQQLFTKARTIYDHIIIYAPDAQLPPYICELITTAMFFGSDDSMNHQMQNIMDGLSVTPCRVLSPSDLFQAV